MSFEHSNKQRRQILQVATAMGALGLSTLCPVSALTGTPKATGKAGDFDFLTGHWTIAHRRLRDDQWDHFTGEASVTSLLGGLVSVEELRIPSRNFSGMGLRVLDVERKLWADYWLNSRTGVLPAAPVWGGFANGVGVWDSEDSDGGGKVVVRGTWDQIGAEACCWTQALSRDQGVTWEENWHMQWRRSKA